MESILHVAGVALLLLISSEGGSMDDSVTTGFAAMRGRLLGFLVTSSIAVVMVGLVAAAVVS